MIGLSFNTNATTTTAIIIIMDDDIRHICDELLLPRLFRKAMEESGICTAESLMAAKEGIKTEEFFRDMKSMLAEKDLNLAREKLLVVIEWREKNPDANIIEMFSEKVYNDIRLFADFVDDYIKTALGKSNLKEGGQLYRDMEEEDLMLMSMIDKCKDIILESNHLRSAIGKFDYHSFLDKAIRHFHALVGNESGALEMEKLFIVAGRTQAGKSAVKGVIQSLCGLLRIPLIILTKGVGESIDLHAKLVGLSAGTLVKKEHIIVAASSKMDGDGGIKEKNKRINKALKGGSHGGTLIIADTKAQVNKACLAIERYRDQIPGGKFILIVDEADEMFRTTDRHQVFERALAKLQALNPSMASYHTVMISATPIPFMVDLVWHGRHEDDIEFFNLHPHDEYIGLEDVVPLKVEGKEVFLEQNELNNRSVYSSDGVNVEYANDKLIALYDDGLSDLDGHKGVLILDCSCPHVNVQGNIKDKAASVQKLYKLKGVKVTVLTISGGGISVKFPREKWDNESWKKSLITQTLEYIDKTFGLSMPVIIFGYTKMCRGVSFRSSKRVPTHMLLALGRGHNASNVVQTLGRATFNGRSVLNENGFDKVTVLMTSNDLTMCVKIQNYVNQVAHRMQQGDTLAQAMTGANEKLPDSANWLRHTPRELGRIKGGRERFKVVRFCDKRHELTPDEREMKEMFWDDSDAQRLLRSLARLRKTHKLVCKEDIDHDLLETEDHRMLKKVQGSLLQKFCDKSLISKDKSSNDKGNYSVPSVNRLAPFINPELGDSPPDDEDEDDDDVDDVDEDEDDYDSESSGLENGELCEENSSLGSKSQESLPGSMAMDCNDESKHLSKKVVSPVVCRDRTKVKSEPSTDVNNVTCRSDTVGIATRAKVDVQQIVRSYGKMTTRSRNSPIVSRLNLNNDENKLDGSKESPIPIESSDDSSVSSITMSFESNNEITTPSFRKSCRSSREIITPIQKCRDHMAMNSERLTNVEDVQWNEIKTPSSRKAVRSSRKIITRKKKCKDHAIDEEHLTNVEDVPMGGVGENRAGKCIEQPEKKRRVYYTDINDTTSKIAKRFQVDVEQVIRDNKRRKKYGNISKSSGFELNSPIVLPM